jgi:cell division transport system ATP-binding protein
MINLVDVGLAHPRGGLPLLSGANLSVARGDVVVIVGAAGVGTSRLVAATLGEAELSAGRIEIMSRDISKLRRSSLRLLRRRVGIVPQDLCLLDERTAEMNVMLPLEIDGIPRSVSQLRAATVLAELSLEAQAQVDVGELSASMRQRVAVARALVREPEIILADQPTSLQDATGADIICTALAAAAHRGAACMILGRDPALRNIAELYNWKQVVIVEGQLVPIDELYYAGTPIEAALDISKSAPVAMPQADNVVPFPMAGAR